MSNPPIRGNYWDPKWVYDPNLHTRYWMYNDIWKFSVSLKLWLFDLGYEPGTAPFLQKYHRILYKKYDAGLIEFIMQNNKLPTISHGPSFAQKLWEQRFFPRQ